MRDKTAKISSDYTMPCGTLLRVKLYRELALQLTFPSDSIANLSFNVLGDVLRVSTVRHVWPWSLSAPSPQ